MRIPPGGLQHLNCNYRRAQLHQEFTGNMQLTRVSLAIFVFSVELAYIKTCALLWSMKANIWHSIWMNFPSR